MGLTKTEMFSTAQNEIAILAKAISHPARVAILEYLFKLNSCIGVDLIKEIGLAQPTISQHLRELKNLGLIKTTAKGTKLHYCINTERWKKMKDIVSDFLNQDIAYRRKDC